MFNHVYDFWRYIYAGFHIIKYDKRIYEMGNKSTISYVSDIYYQK